MRSHCLIGVCLTTLALTACQPSSQTDVAQRAKTAEPALNSALSLSEQYQKLAQSYYQARLALEPMLATKLGEQGHQHRFGMPFSEGYLKARHELNFTYLAQLAALDWQQLQGDELLSAKLLRYELEFALKDETFPSRFLPITPWHNPVLTLAQFASTTSENSWQTQGDYDDFIARLSEFSAWITTAIQRMEQGAEQNIVLPRLLVHQVIAQLAPVLALPLEQNPFYQPLLRLPAELNSAEQQSLQADYQQVLTQDLLPALKRLQQYLQQDYLAKARGSVAWQNLPNGKAWYQHLVEQHTTLPLSVDVLYRQGLADVAELQPQLKQMQAQLGHQGDLKQFFHTLRSEPEFSALQQQGRFILAPLPSEVSSLLPSFHRAGNYSAFELGGALYFTHLQWQNRIETEPSAALALLLSQNLQALRLVIDLGLHAKGWSQAQAIQYLLDHSPLTRHEAEAEVIHAIGMPGQLLAHQIGLQAFWALHQQAQEHLGQHFVIARFHTQLMEAGALPLPLLEQKVQTWLQSQSSGLTDQNL